MGYGQITMNQSYVPYAYFYKVTTPTNSFTRDYITIGSNMSIKCKVIEQSILNPIIQIRVHGTGSYVTSTTGAQLTFPAFIQSNWVAIRWSVQVNQVETLNPLQFKPKTKYYFIESYKILSGYIIEFQLTEDVLYTYKDEILANKALISRQEHKRNGWIVDPEFTITQKPNTQVLELPNGFNRSESSFILTTLGGV